MAGFEPADGAAVAGPGAEAAFEPVLGAVVPGAVAGECGAGWGCIRALPVRASPDAATAGAAG